VFIVQCDGKFVDMPLDGNWMVPGLDGYFPDKVMLRMDAREFQAGFINRAVWTRGEGPYASLAYCGAGLTIRRFLTLKGAIEAKRAIDGAGCGGGCCRIHVIVQVDADNPRNEMEQANIRAYVAGH
jgi:hypothetical protein